MADPNCPNCPWRAKYDNKPRSFLGWLWRMHAHICPGWRAYMKSLPDDERVEIAALVPAANPFGYRNALRSLSEGEVSPVFFYEQCLHLVRIEELEPELFGQGLQNRLSYPPNGILYKFKSPGFIKSCSCLYQPKISFVDQIGK